MWRANYNFVLHVSATKQVADIFTKKLPVNAFLKFHEELLGWQMSANKFPVRDCYVIGSPNPINHHSNADGEVSEDHKSWNEVPGQELNQFYFNQYFDSSKKRYLV